MNGLLASQAVTLVLAVSTGYVAGEHIAKGGWWQYDALEGQLDFSSLTFRRPACPACAEEGHGDPWFVWRLGDDSAIVGQPKTLSASRVNGDGKTELKDLLCGRQLFFDAISVPSSCSGR